MLALAPHSSTSTLAPYLADTYTPYFEYDGPLRPKGTAIVDHIHHRTLALSFWLTNLDARCEAGPSTSPNSCGVHVHANTTCAAGAGPHLYATPDDPWLDVTYANADAVSTTFDVAPLGNNRRGSFLVSLNKGGSKHKSRKSRKTKKSKKTKKGCGAHQGGKKKCPKHCRRKTSRTRKGLKRRKN